MAQSVWALTEQPKQILDVIEVDPAWQKFLPSGSKVIATAGHGASFWSQTARIDVQLENGDEQSFFLKLAPLFDMVQGEFKSMEALYKIAPHMIPQPMGFGTRENEPGTHFFLCEFIELHDELPDIVDFCRDVAELHQRSMTQSDGRFGFPVITCNGTVPQRNEWTSSWETFFIEALKYEFELERNIHGTSDDIDRMLPDLLHKVCPRLLRPLETDGRDLRPCLIHGDCWDGNIAVHAETGQAYIYDSSAFWGHNEYEMHMWRGERYRLRKPFVKEYYNHFPISAPENDWDDRNLLYSLRADLHDSILFPSTDNFRNLIIATMASLIEKFPKGYNGTSPCKDTQVFPNESSPKASTAHEQAQVAAQHSDPSQNLGIRSSQSNVSPSIDALLRNTHVSEDVGHRSQTAQSSPTRVPEDGDSDIRLGESALSPYEGSVASGY